MAIILFLLTLAGVAFYLMKPEERQRVIIAGRDAWERLQAEAIRRWRERNADGAARQPSPLPIATVAIVLVNVWIFLGMFGDVALNDPKTLVPWGGNFGPRTTNNEWWRLVTAMFLHSGLIQLVVNLAALVQLGVVMERMVGSLAFTAVYLAAGILASLTALSESPVNVNSGASGAIFGVFGLWTAACLWALVRRSPLPIPAKRLKRFVALTALFVLHNIATGFLSAASEAMGVSVGFISGLVLASGAVERQPAARRVAAVGAVTLAFAVALAVPLRGIIDVMPEIARVIATETRTASVYDAAVDRFRLGRMKDNALADVIDRRILPELQATRARLNVLGRVPLEQRPLLDAAAEYLQLRAESWRLRSEGLREASLPMLQKADRSEWKALAVLAVVREKSSDAGPAASGS